MQLAHRRRGFSLIEMAVVLAIVGLLIGGAMMTLSGQVEQRNNDETLRRLNAAAEALLAFAIVNRRLPCPARYSSDASNSQGQESFCTNATAFPCTPGNETITPQLHGNCSHFYNGFVPAASIGIAPVDALGFAVDSWGNRLRYVVAKDHAGPNCTVVPASTPPIPPDTRMFTSKDNLKTWGVACRPNDLDVCTTAACASRVVSSGTGVFIVYSTGKNGALAADALLRPNENENLNGDARFVHRTPDPTGAAGGEFDDMMVIVPVGILYSKLIAAGVLP